MVYLQQEGDSILMHIKMLLRQQSLLIKKKAARKVSIAVEGLQPGIHAFTALLSEEDNGRHIRVLREKFLHKQSICVM